MRLKLNTPLVTSLLAMTLAVSCRPEAGTDESNTQDLTMLVEGGAKRLSAMQGRAEIIVYYANETRLRPDESVAMGHYLASMKSSRDPGLVKLGDAIANDMKLFPSVVESETADLESAICRENVNPSVAGVVVFTNALFYENSYAVCRAGEGALKKVPFKIPPSIEFGQPAARPETLTAALLEAKKLSTSPETVFSAIIKSHGSQEKVVANCYPAFMDVAGSSAKSAFFTPALNPGRLPGVGDAYPTFSVNDIPKLDSNQRIGLGVEGAKRGSGGKLGLNCESGGIDIASMFRAFQEFEAVGGAFGVIFLESCKSALRAARHPPQATIWGSDRNGLEFRTVPSYREILGTRAPTEDEPPLFALNLNNYLNKVCVEQSERNKELSCQPTH